MSMINWLFSILYIYLHYILQKHKIYKNLFLSYFDKKRFQLALQHELFTFIQSDFNLPCLADSQRDLRFCCF